MNVFGEACTDSGANLGAMLSPTDFCGLLCLLEAMARPHGRGDRFLNVHHLPRARIRELSHENSTTGANRSWGRTFHFFQKSSHRVVEFRAVALKVLPLFREKTWAKSEETGAELGARWKEQELYSGRERQERWGRRCGAEERL